MIINKFSLEGKVAIVTGARTGLGQAMAIALAEAGADIVGVGREVMPETEKAVTCLKRKFLFIKADLLTTKPINRIIEETITTFGKIDILVNNAGIVRRSEPIDFTEEDWNDVMNLNLKSVFFLSQAVARKFIKQGNGGKIINMASMLSFQGGTRDISYTASKFGIVGITKTMSNS
jgi:2-dehydro-3-deoxy-D-gluconate 5-dehydrogenase